jgi:hypothetical protein
MRDNRTTKATKNKDSTDKKERFWRGNNKSNNHEPTNHEPNQQTSNQTATNQPTSQPATQSTAGALTSKLFAEPY